MKKLLSISVVIGVVASVWAFSGDDDSDDDKSVNDGAEVTWNNRVWIEKMPTKHTEKVDLMLSVDDPRVGVFQRTSSYEGDFSVFIWSGDDGAVKLRMLQTDKTSKLTFKTKSKGCGDFDYCMTVKGAPRGGKKYYSMSDWVIEGGNLDADLLATTAREHVSTLVDAHLTKTQ